MTKVCSKCGEEKDITDFARNKDSKDGYRSNCKFCQKEWREENKKKYEPYHKEYRKKHISERKNYYKQNKNYILKKKKKYRKRCDVKKRTNIYYKTRRKIDKTFKLMSYVRNRINKALKENWKSGHTLELLGCSISHFKLYLELQFPEGMTWNNYGLYGWHIDHIIPCASFDLSDPEEQKKCFHYSNLQPLWAEDNLRKGDKVDKGM